MKYQIVQVHPDDELARRSIYEVLRSGHRGRIRQGVLDFWRRDYSKFIAKAKGGDVVFLLALSGPNLVGMSCAAILKKSRRCINSMTVVADEYTKNGIGTSLLRSKIHLLNIRYPNAFLVTYVNKKNAASLKMCERAGLSVISEGTREREDKEANVFYVLSNKPISGKVG